MIKIKITAIRQTTYDDLSAMYENKLEIPCGIKLNSVYISEDLKMPLGFCKSAWETLSPFIISLSKGEELFTGWMKNKKQAFVSCNDGGSYA